MTLGEYRVGIEFVPSNNSHVDAIKRLTANLIDLVNSIDVDANPEISRLAVLALTHFEIAAMWAVKAATKERRIS